MSITAKYVEEKPHLWLCFIFGLFNSLMISQRVRAPQNEFYENSEKYNDRLLPWLAHAGFVLAHLQVFAIDMCENNAIRLNGHVIKYIDGIHLINSVRSGSLAKLWKITMSINRWNFQCCLCMQEGFITFKVFLQYRWDPGMFRRCTMYIRVLESLSNGNGSDNARKQWSDWLNEEK